jgi:murein hydrolase activator
MCKNIYISFLFVFFVSVFANAQTKSDLQNDKAQIEKELSYTNQLLNKTRSEKKTSMNELYVIDNKIKNRNAMIRNINKEIGQIDKSIVNINDSIAILEKELQILKDEYALIIQNTWNNKNSYKRLSYIFAAKDLNQAFKRIAFFKYYSDKRKQYYNDILKISMQLQYQQDALLINKNSKKSLVDEKEVENAALKVEQTEKNMVIQDLSKKEKELAKKIKEQQKALDKLKKEIEAIIAAEIKARNKNSSRLELTPEEKIISSEFAGNKGKLPWPCERGIITEQFGEHPHPVLKNIKVNLNGIRILTESKSFARSVFNGKVTKIMNVPQFNNVVIVRHGDYLTVYSNLSEVLVNVGDNVSTKQNIGVIYNDPSENTAKLHFEIWKDTTPVNPELWIKSK